MTLYVTVFQFILESETFLRRYLGLRGKELLAAFAPSYLEEYK